MISARVESTYVDRALQQLAHAVLLQTLHDVEKGSNSQRADTMMWMYGGTRAPLTFEFCRSIIGREPEDVRYKFSDQEVFPE